jgi:hypothetical protein
MNRRNKEFAEEVQNLLCTIWNLAHIEAMKKNVSIYDVEIEVEQALTIHMTQQMIATEMCARRHFDNLKNRNLFISCGSYDCEKIKFNPQWANLEVDLLVGRFRMPKNEPVITAP